jgi:IS30 family transposase
VERNKKIILELKDEEGKLYKKKITPSYSVEHYIHKFQKENPNEYCPSKSQVYRLIYHKTSGFKKYWFPVLRFGKGGKKVIKKKGYNNNKYTNISFQEAYNVLLGHYQADSVEGKRTDKVALATIIDVTTGMVRINLYDRGSTEFALVTKKAVEINGNQFESLRLDNGKENAKLGEVFPKDKIFNCDTYSS